VSREAVIAWIVAGEQEAEIHVAVLDAETQEASAAVAGDAYTHILTNHTYVIGASVIAGRNRIGGTVALAGWNDEPIRERFPIDVATIIADCADDVEVRGRRLSKQQHRR
jgi:hypothetical protein